MDEKDEKRFEQIAQEHAETARKADRLALELTELKAMVADMTDEEIWKMNRGGHDPVKVYNAYAAAVRHKSQPTVILPKTEALPPQQLPVR